MGPEQNTISSSMKHERVDEAIDRMGRIVSELERLRNRINDNDYSLPDEAPVPRVSLSGVLNNAPDRIRANIDTSLSLIDEIEALLF